MLKNKEYDKFIKSIKERIRAIQIKTAVTVNRELLLLYWELGEQIVAKQKITSWGSNLISQMSKDLQNAFPGVKGFSERNLKYMRQWYLFWKDKATIGQQLVAQIPWGHNIIIISKCKSKNEAIFYIKNILLNGWSRSILTHNIESNLFKREGKAITNFPKTLPMPQSALAKDVLKDPYCFDFLTITEMHNEKELEDALINHLTKFLLELGTGFSFIGRQYRLEIEDDEYFIDLLFYHTKLHSYIVIELKTIKFKPEFTGKLNFYISAVDDLLKSKKDNSTIGILICKSKNNTVVEYALKDIGKPIGVSEYIITRNLPDDYKSSLPSIEDIEAELNEYNEK